MFGNILLTAVGIGLLIFVHELGHFLAARLAGVRVEVFSLGFGSRLCGFVWRGTDFRLSLVPFGGYVMVAGQDPNDDRYPPEECLWSKSVGQRALFWSGGVLMNALTALILFPIVFSVGVDFAAPVVGGVERGSPAWEAGLQAEDRVVRVADKPVHSFDQVRMQVALAGNRPIPLLLRRPDGSERTVSVKPRWNANEGLWGLGLRVAIDPQKPPTVQLLGDCPLATAGVRSEDEILAIDGKPVDASTALERLLTSGPELALRIRRGTTELDVRYQPATGKAPRIGVAPAETVVAGVRRGVPLLERLDLRRDDLVLQVDGKVFAGGPMPIGDGDQLRILVARDGRTQLLQTDCTAAERQSLRDDVVLKAGSALTLVPTDGSAAQAAGMQPGDLLVAVDGAACASFDDLRERVEKSAGRPLRLSMQRAIAAGDDLFDPTTEDLRRPQTVELTITPVVQDVPDPMVRVFATERSELVQATSFGNALQLGTAQSLDLVKQIYLTLKRMLTGDVGAKNLGGIIRISQVGYQAAKRGMAWFVFLLAMLSVNLAFVNLLPVPVLDGGHLLFLLIEKVKGSPVNARVLGYSQVLGLVFVLLLVLLVTFNDIVQLF
ncbi:MAG: site-2 protease family protein [Planctomycetota bacterium]|jgi:regulator of sigma E protease